MDAYLIRVDLRSRPFDWPVWLRSTLSPFLTTAVRGDAHVFSGATAAVILLTTDNLIGVGRGADGSPDLMIWAEEA